jgi:hypothetical protein
MHEPCDDFLSSARLASEQHCRLGQRDLSCLPEHILPLWGRTDDARMLHRRPVVTAHRHARLDPSGAGLVSGGMARFARQLLMGNAEREVTRNAAGQRQILWTERVWLLRPERDGQDLAVGPRRHADHRAVTARDQLLAQLHAGRHRQRLPGEIPDDEVVNRRQLQALRRHRGKVAGRGLDDGVAALIAEHHRHSVVRQQLLDDVRQPWKNRPDIERVCHRAKQLERDVEVRVSRFTPNVTRV